LIWIFAVIALALKNIIPTKTECYTALKVLLVKEETFAEPLTEEELKLLSEFKEPTYKPKPPQQKNQEPQSEKPKDLLSIFGG
jgi:hypothetical protein